MKHALRIAAHTFAAHPLNIYPLAARNRLSAAFRDAASEPPSAAMRVKTEPETGFSPLVQDFLDECGYSER